MAQVLTVGIQPLNYDHKFSLRATARGGGGGWGEDFIGQTRVAELINQGKELAVRCSTAPTHLAVLVTPGPGACLWCLGRERGCSKVRDLNSYGQR